MINEDGDDGIINDTIISTEDFLEALKIGRKYVEDLERLEADLVIFKILPNVKCLQKLYYKFR